MTPAEPAETQTKPQLPTGSLWENRITVAGVALAVLAFLFFIIAQVVEALSPASNPYRGIWSFMILPVFLIIGLVLIPCGWALERRRRQKLFPEIHEWQRFPRLDFNNPFHRKVLRIFATGTLVVVPFIGITTYEGYHYTDSNQFCGQVCHEVMDPEYTAYSNSPHARVSCAACHIGPGASWFVKAKISGIRQVFATTFNTFSRPIPTPIEDLRPARETCEQCHWPAKFFGAQLRTRYHYAPDEKNTRTEIAVVIKTGGGDSSNGPASGIHWHMALSNKIEYVATDDRRQIIPWTRATNLATGEVAVFRSDGRSATDPSPEGELRTVDCLDCHNRPTHIYPAPDRTVNVSLETGRLDRTLPFIKKIAVEALVGSYRNQEEAISGIDSRVRDFYAKSYPEIAGTRKASIDQAVEEVTSIYRRSFFPAMRTDWRVHPDNIGHMVFDGCFRCHDDKHVGAKGALTKNCDVCHDFGKQIVGPDSGLALVRIRPDHPVKLLGIHAELNCSLCHTGGMAPDPTCAGCHQVQTQFREGKSPELSGLGATPPSVMADLDCESCHDLTEPQQPADLAKHCETCHDKGYGEMVQMWKDDASASRAKAAAAVEELRRTAAGLRDDSARETAIQLASQLESALLMVDKAGTHHNIDFAESVYQQVIKLAGEHRQTQSSNDQGIQ